MSRYKAEFYPEANFGGFSWIDDTVAFYCRVNALINPTSTVLDFGCGRGQQSEDPIRYRRELRNLKTKVGRVIGVDVDEVGSENETLHEFRPLRPDQDWPIRDHSIDLIVCDHVVEHLPAPATLFREARRVLRKQGYLCIRTPNVMSYFGVASKLIPNRLHGKVLSRVQSGRKQEDVFPTLYRCNTIWSLRREFSRHGFRAVVNGHESEPAYLEFSKVAYAAGSLYGKISPQIFKSHLLAYGASES